MNERITELAEQAGFDLDVHGSNDGNFYGWEGRWINSDIQKFAELIIEECVRYVNEDYRRDFDSLWREDLSKGIERHFGVE